MQLTLDTGAARANSRLAAIRLAVLTSRCMENWRRDAGDLDNVMILLAVVAISGDRLTRTVLSDDLRALDTELPKGMRGECNVSSIASATGLNRETTRRKVRGLIDDGFLGRTPEGEIFFAPGVMQREATFELLCRQLEAITRFANDCLRDGVLRAA
jgi:hypothetical protein